MATETREERALRLIHQKGAIRAADLAEHGIARTALSRLLQKGLIERVERGLYRPSASDAGEHQTMALAAQRIPGGVICLLSALSYHGLTTEIPHQVWMAIDRHQAVPKIQRIPIRLHRLSGQSFSEGVQEVSIDGMKVRVYSPAKTVADCFKFRNRIGLDVALNALRDCLDQRMCSRDELWRFAKINRVQNVMLPYLEATT